jgi:molecular chaperone DnaJ
MSRDYYEILGIGRDATHDDVKKAYRKEALRHHPDRNPGDKDAETRFKEAAEAYEVLSDPQTRSRYDRYGHDGLRNAGVSHGFSSVDDIFRAFGDIFGGGGGSIFDDLFGLGGRRSGSRGRRGASLRCEVRIGFEEMARGVEKTISLKRNETCAVCTGTGAKPGTSPRGCSYCHGRGEIQQSQGFFTLRTVCPKCNGEGVTVESPCQECNGSGKQPVAREIRVRIPAGIEDGTQIRMTGEGEAGERGAPPGDLYCEVHVGRHPIFERDGYHLLCDVPVTITQSALGATIRIPGVDGEIDFEVPRGTQPMETFRIRGKGLPDVHGRGVGDLILRVSVETPRHLSKRQEELLREFAETEDVEVSPRRKSFFEKVKELFGQDDE